MPEAELLQRLDPARGILGNACRLVIEPRVTIWQAAGQDEEDGTNQFVRQHDDSFLVAASDDEAVVFRGEDVFGASGGIGRFTEQVLQASPPPHLARPVPHGPPVGLALDHVMGLPVLRQSLSSVHAVVTTPAESPVAFFALFTSNVSLPRISAGSASALPFTRPAQRSLALRTARSPSHFHDPLHQRLHPLRYLHDCSSCYRPERKLPGGVRTH